MAPETGAISYITISRGGHESLPLGTVSLSIIRPFGP